MTKGENKGIYCDDKRNSSLNSQFRQQKEETMESIEMTKRKRSQSNGLG